MPVSDSGFVDYRLEISGRVEHPVELSLEDLRALPPHEQITQHFCIQGWSGVAKWGGVSMTTILDLVEPHPDAEWVVFYSFGEGADGGIYYDAHPIEEMRGELAMLAFDMNGEPLPFGYGAPLRLRNEVQLGFKQVKWIKGIELVAGIDEVAAATALQRGPRVLRIPPGDLTVRRSEVRRGRRANRTPRDPNGGRSEWRRRASARRRVRSAGASGVRRPGDLERPPERELVRALRSPPTGRPLAMRLTVSPGVSSTRVRYSAVASPSMLRLVQTMTSVIPSEPARASS